MISSRHAFHGSEAVSTKTLKWRHEPLVYRDGCIRWPRWVYSRQHTCHASGPAVGYSANSAGFLLTMSQPFQKPPLTFEQQLQQLIGRGLIVGDTQRALTFLRRANYYRFSGYCIPFESTRHQFRPGALFEDVAELYEFDNQLRLLVQEALALIEVCVKTQVAYLIAHRSGGAFGHLDQSKYQSHFDFIDWRNGIRKEVERSKETFVEHFKTNYTEFPDLPIWAEVEVQSFGSFSRMVAGFNKGLQRDVARLFNLHGGSRRQRSTRCGRRAFRSASERASGSSRRRKRKEENCSSPSAFVPAPSEKRMERSLPRLWVIRRRTSLYAPRQRGDRNDLQDHRRPDLRQYRLQSNFLKAKPR